MNTELNIIKICKHIILLILLKLFTIYKLVVILYIKKEFAFWNIFLTSFYYLKYSFKIYIYL